MERGLDWPLLIIVLTLVGFGLVMLFSASYPAGYYRFGDSYEFIRPQMFYAAVGIIAMFVISHIDDHILHRFALPLMALSITLLVLVLIIGSEYNGAKRWINLGFGTLQPSEIAKFAVIALFAHIISLNHDKMKTFRYGVLPFLLVLGAVAGLMLLEPHLSGTIIILGIVAGAVLLVPDLVPYAMDRIEMWQNPFIDPKGYQTVQGLYAIASGGLTGLGIGNSRQKHLYVPEPYNDFIFAITCEELGFIGALLVIFLFVALLLRGIYVAANARDKFGSMLVVGVIVQITLQAALNIAVVTNTIPNTGISLPFFSSGGTSLVMLLCEMGVVLNVSRQSAVKRL